MNDLFVGSRIEVPVFTDISLNIVNSELNDRQRVKTKRYVYSKLKVDFNVQPNDQRTWSEQCLDAVADYITQSDIWKNRVVIVEASFNDRRTVGTVCIECYLWEKLCK